MGLDNPMRLVGDFGGTKTNLAVFDGGQISFLRNYESRKYLGMVQILQDFLQCLPIPIPSEAMFAVAGTIEETQGRGQKVSLTNLPWVVTTEQVNAILPNTHVRFCNDFLSTARMCVQYAKTQAALGPNSEIVSLYVPPNHRLSGPIGVLGAGTGLGEAFVSFDEQAISVFPSEGGHCDFAPVDDVEIALLRFLQAQHGDHVSYERILSGGGIASVYQFFLERFPSSQTSQPEDIKQAMRSSSKDLPALISKHALWKDDPVCVQTIDTFVRVYGSEAGNLALKMLPWGGIYLCGGIAPKLLPLLQTGGFLQRFFSKGRMRHVCEAIPVYVVKDSLAPLRGAGYLLL